MKVVLAWGLLCGLAAGGAAQDSTPTPAPDFERYLADCETYGFSGCVLVAKDGKVLVRRAFGLADRAAGTPNAPETRFEIASASKQFTAAAVLKLVEAGKLSLDDSIAKRLPGVPEEHAGVTVAHLLHHTSGFPRMGPSGRGADLAAAVAGYLKGRRTAEPGKRHEYWNGGYALLAGIVETTSGTPFTDFCKKELFERAGLTQTTFCGEPCASAARGDQEGKDVGPAGSHSFGWEYRGMGGVVTTIDDLYRWDRALRGDAVLSKAMRDVLFAPSLDDYACGWNVVQQGPLGRVAEHGGTVAGFETEMLRCLDRDACVFVVSNRRGCGWQVGYQLAQMAFGDAFTLGQKTRTAPPAVVDPPSGGLARVAGRYALPSGAAFVVRVEGRGLVVSAEGQEAVDALSPAAAKAGDHREAREVAARIIDQVSKGDSSLVQEKVVEAFWSKTWPKTLVESIWPKHVEKWGALKASEPVAARKEGPKGVRVWVRLHHERGDPVAEIAFLDGRLTILDLAGHDLSAQAVYAPTRDGAFTAYDFGRPTPPAITFAEDGLRIGALAARRKTE